MGWHSHGGWLLTMLNCNSWPLLAVTDPICSSTQSMKFSKINMTRVITWV